MQGRMDSPVNQNGISASVFGTSAPQIPMGQHPFPFVGPMHHVPIHVPQGTHRGAFPGAFAPSVVPNGAVFGAIGQTPKSQFQNSQGLHAMNATPPGSPNLARAVSQGSQVSFVTVISFSMLSLCHV